MTAPTGTGVTATHTYAAAGTYTVTLTVTDNDGTTNAVTHPVTVAAASPTTLASDVFNRTAVSKWGNADIGGAWTVQGSAATAFGVTPGSASMKVPAGGNLGAFLNALNLTDATISADVSVDKAITGGGAYAYVVARHAAGSEYRLRTKLLATGGVQVSLTKLVGTAETVLVTQTVTGLVFTGGSTTLHLRFQVSGSSTVALNGRVWAAGTTEPTTWQVSKTDTTATLLSGAPGLSSYLSGTATNAPLAVSYANFAAGVISTP